AVDGVEGELLLAERFEGAVVPGVVPDQGDKGVLVALVVAEAQGQGGEEPERLPTLVGGGAIAGRARPGGERVRVATGRLQATGEGEQRAGRLRRRQVVRQRELKLFDGGRVFAFRGPGAGEAEAGVPSGAAAGFDVLGEGVAGGVRAAGFLTGRAQEEERALPLRGGRGFVRGGGEGTLDGIRPA